MDSEELRDRAFGEFLFAWIIPSAYMRDGELFSTAGTHIFKSRTPNWFFNGLMRNKRYLPVDEALELVQLRLSDRDFKVVARDWIDEDLFIEAMKLKGAEELDHTVSIMVLESPLPQIESKLRMDISSSGEALEDWRRIGIDVFSEDEPEFIKPLEQTLLYVDELVNPGVVACVAYEGDTPVCIGQLGFSHGIAGIYWVATVKDKRHRGYATALTTYLVNLAFDRGAQAVTLQASGAEPVYEAMGFKTVGKLKVVVVKR